ncbi:MAG: hypothetical protein IKU55_01585, partial [Clostridia bacterium]|nr:hypothetical protein [Clostridia bacterium]
MHPQVLLTDFCGGDDLARFTAALAHLRTHPGTTLLIPPGTYRISTPRARKAQASVMSGAFGKNPEPTMFSPHYVYDRGLDFDGHVDSTVLADGVTLLVDGFMEPVSIRNCRNVTVQGLTIDHARKPYSKGIVIASAPDGSYTAIFTDAINPDMPTPRKCFFSQRTGVYEPRVKFRELNVVDPHTIHGTLEAESTEFLPEVGDELYLCHTYHSRPAVLIEEAKNTTLRNITIHSNPGMGITAQHAEDVCIEHLRVVPSPGDHMSTNTDATHFASCRGTIRISDSEFFGQGDDSVNVHTYYYTPHALGECTYRFTVDAPTFTHTQSIDYPLVGDTLALVETDSLTPIFTCRVTEVAIDQEHLAAVVITDAPLPLAENAQLVADLDAVPRLEFVGCRARSHFARSVLVKCREALIENCVIEDVFENAVKVAAESYWKEGIHTEQIVIRNCRFANNGRKSAECGGIAVYMDVPRADA